MNFLRIDSPTFRTNTASPEDWLLHTERLSPLNKKTKKAFDEKLRVLETLEGTQNTDPNLFLQALEFRRYKGAYCPLQQLFHCSQYGKDQGLIHAQDSVTAKLYLYVGATRLDAALLSSWEKGNYKMVEFFLQQGACANATKSLNFVTNDLVSFPLPIPLLLLSALQGDGRMCALLIKYGADIGEQDKDSFCIKTFLDSIRFKLRNGQYPLLEPILAEVDQSLIFAENEWIAELCLFIGATALDEALHNAIVEKNQIMTRFFLEHAANPSYKAPTQVNGKEITYPLCWTALHCENVDAFFSLVLYGADLNVQDKTGNTLLMLSIKVGNFSLSLMLLEQPQIDCHLENQNGDTALSLWETHMKGNEQHHEENERIHLLLTQTPSKKTGRSTQGG